MNEGSSVYLRSSTCEVSENTFRKNQRGIFLESNNNIIKENKLYDSSASGVYTQLNTINNIFYLNDFKGNTVSAREFGSNIWYYENQGNYWDDYILYDKDLDGIADEAYFNNGIYDLYPLGYFVKPPKKPYDPFPADKATGVGLHVTLQVTVEDPDSDELTVYFYKEDSTLLDGLTNNPVKKVSSNDFASFTFVLGFNTTFAWYAVVNDGILENQSSPFIFFTAVTPPDNIPPLADAGGPYSGRMDDIIQFDSSGSKDDDGKIDFYRWNFGDGSSEIIKENPTHSYSNQGTYIVTLTVIDNDGSSDSTTAQVDISYREFNPPTVNVLIPSNGKTGKTVSFSSTGTVDPDGDDLSYLWDFGDGTTSTLKNPTHKYKKAGKYLVNLKVSDNKFSEEKSGVITITKPSEESPGFEIVLFLVGILALSIIKKLNRKR
jgi:parallel beta-helix repeat protein